jgi:hypothetical protein
MPEPWVDRVSPGITAAEESGRPVSKKKRAATAAQKLPAVSKMMTSPIMLPVTGRDDRPPGRLQGRNSGAVMLDRVPGIRGHPVAVEIKNGSGVQVTCRCPAGQPKSIRSDSES